MSSINAISRTDHLNEQLPWIDSLHSQLMDELYHFIPKLIQDISVVTSDLHHGLNIISTMAHQTTGAVADIATQIRTDGGLLPAMKIALSELKSGINPVTQAIKPEHLAAFRVDESQLKALATQLEKDTKPLEQDIRNAGIQAITAAQGLVDISRVVLEVYNGQFDQSMIQQLIKDGNDIVKEMKSALQVQV
ncbi:MAG: hypothetical protein ACPGUD_11500 [Parashewanella sp.]